MKQILRATIVLMLFISGCGLPNVNNTSVVTSYYRTKELLAEVHKKGEVRHGPAIKYYKNGNIMEEAIYKDDKKDGSNNTYYENGKPKTQNIFSEGVLLSYMEFDEEGSLVKERYCQMLWTAHIHPVIEFIPFKQLSS